MDDFAALESLQFQVGFPPEGQEVRLPDPVDAVELPDQQFRVGVDPKPPDPKFPGFLQAQEQSPVFRHIVSGLAQISLLLHPDFAVRVQQDDPGPGQARVAPGGAVAVKEPNAFLLLLITVSHLLIDLPQVILIQVRLFCRQGQALSR
jgi:hypothetical protein